MADASMVSRNRTLLLQYKHRMTMKAQVLVDFIVECSFNKEKELREPNRNEERNKVQEEGEDEGSHMYHWTLHVDGVAGPSQNGAGTILEAPNGLVISYALQFDFLVTNNMVEYEVLINGMQLAMGIIVSDLKVFSDSQLIVNLIQGMYKRQGTK